MGDTADPIRVRHVDDDPAFVELTARLLEREDDRLEVTGVTGPEAGLDAFEAEPFDCVVSDHDMPGTDGLAFLEAIRERDEAVPFVLFTGEGNERVAGEAISAGVTDYLQKGAGDDQYAVLANRVTNAVAAYRARRRAARQERINTLIRDVNRRLVNAGSVEGSSVRSARPSPTRSRTGSRGSANRTRRAARWSPGPRAATATSTSRE